MSVVTTVFIVYLAVLAVLALWSRQESHSMSGYFIAGKKLPPWVVAFSTNATGESGWLLLGLTGMGYAVGAQAFWVVAGEVVGIALAWLLWLKPYFYDLLEVIPGFLVGFALTLIISKATKSAR